MAAEHVMTRTSMSLHTRSMGAKWLRYFQLKQFEGFIMYFIYDCQNNIVGNHKGYTTMKGANYALKRYFKRKLWERFYSVVDSGKVDSHCVWSIKFQGETLYAK